MYAQQHPGQVLKPRCSFSNFIVSYPPLLQREKGVGWGRSLLLVEHICMCLLLSKTGFLCKHKNREGGGEGARANLICLNNHFWSMGWASSCLNCSSSHKMTENLCSGHIGIWKYFFLNPVPGASLFYGQQLNALKC
jgi:hypothetical protein